jgi:hypothetical protein
MAKQPDQQSDMIGKFSKTITAGLLAAGLSVLPPLLRADDAGTNAPPSSGPAPARPRKHVSLPFRGRLTAVDAKALSFTVDTLKLQITTATLITRDGRGATLADGVVGENVSGVYKKTSDGKLMATSLHFGSKTDKQDGSNTNSPP